MLYSTSFSLGFFDVCNGVFYVEEWKLVKIFEVFW